MSDSTKSGRTQKALIVATGILTASALALSTSAHAQAAGASAPPATSWLGKAVSTAFSNSMKLTPDKAASQMGFNVPKTDGHNHVILPGKQIPIAKGQTN